MFLKMEKGEDATATEDEDKADDKQKVETAMRNSQRDREKRSFYNSPNFDVCEIALCFVKMVQTL